MERSREESIHDCLGACKRADCLLQGLNQYTDQRIPHTVISGEAK